MADISMPPEPESSSTVAEQPELPKRTIKDWGKPFSKGDPRINRKGRPKSFDDLRKLAQSLANEVAKDKDGNAIIIEGHIATVGEMILRGMTSNPKQQVYFLEVTYGKVPTPIDVTTDGQRLGSGLDDAQAARLLELLEEARIAAQKKGEGNAGG